VPVLPDEVVILMSSIVLLIPNGSFLVVPVLHSVKDYIIIVNVRILTYLLHGAESFLRS